MANTEAYITGIGQSETGVRLTRAPLLLTVDAIKEALNEAGLTIDQIDGVATYPGKVPQFLGFSPVSSDDVIEAMGIKSKSLIQKGFLFDTQRVRCHRGIKVSNRRQREN